MSVYDVIQRLPDLRTTRRVSRALAVLDLVLNEDPGSRYHSFDARWSETEEAALMRDGSGNEYSIVFSGDGAFAYGFDHESPMSPYVNGMKTWPGLIDGVPEVFHSARDDAAFQTAATVCFWRTTDDTEWRCGPVQNAEKDGADALFELLADSRPEAYLTFAEDYYEVALDLEPIRHIYALMPLTEYVVTSLNPERRLHDLKDEIAEIGYPRS
ncbi:hypothetical protein EV646_105245 [Kribbella antiqua]|uniref:Uncharacterized protein n=1 Tax=Kribbella antiqua TaxID=2512217 RepID=A0A4R2IQP3_9ACTN|nr:hypothetical protein [Kribbella antiqua]TCO47691.1 hypothetical protein EV646_105245 [Kribbella antiqua]